MVASLLALELAPREEVRTRPQGYSLDAAVMHWSITGTVNMPFNINIPLT